MTQLASQVLFMICIKPLDFLYCFSKKRSWV